MKPVFVIMVTYRRFDHFKRTLESLVPSLPEGSCIRIVDNHSDQMEYEKWWWEAHERQWLDKFGKKIAVQILLLEKNIGWGAALNDGLRPLARWKDFEYVLESNNDVTYEPDWCAKAQALMEAEPNIGVLGLNKHPHHGEQRRIGELVIKDDMPATAWFFRSKDLRVFLPFPEHGPTKTRGGNGEDSEFTEKIKGMGMWICGTVNDLAHHADDQGVHELGKENAAYL